MKKIQVLALGAFITTGMLAASCKSGGSMSSNANLKDEIDTLSYAYGVQLVQSGLKPYLQQMGVFQDTAMFRATVEQEIAAEADPAKKAQLEKTLKSRIDSLNNTNSTNLKQFIAGVKESFSETSAAKGAYYSGLQLGNQFKTMSEGFEKNVLNEGDQMNKEAFLAGLIGTLNEEKALVENSTELIQTKAMANQERVLKKQYKSEIEAGEKFLAENKSKAGIIELPSGLQYQILKTGKGNKPTATDKVKVNYTGTLTDGTVFDSNKGQAPITLGVNQVIKGWTEALQLMPIGSKWKLFIPYSLGYGAQQAGSIPPFSTLIFEIELVGIEQ